MSYVNSWEQNFNWSSKISILQNKILTYLWYLNLEYTFRDLGVIQKFNNDNNNDKDNTDVNDEKMKINIVKSKI